MTMRMSPNLLLETRFRESYSLRAAATASVMIGFLLAICGYRSGWVIGLLPSVILLALLARRFSRFSVLLLTPGGFTYESRNSSFSFCWNDVDRFWVSGPRLDRFVAFSVFPGAKPQSSERTLPENYGLGSAEFCALMNEWRLRHSERNARNARRA